MHTEGRSRDAAMGSFRHDNRQRDEPHPDQA